MPALLAGTIKHHGYADPPCLANENQMNIVKAAAARHMKPLCKSMQMVVNDDDCSVARSGHHIFWTSMYNADLPTISSKGHVQSQIYQRR